MSSLAQTIDAAERLAQAGRVAEAAATYSAWLERLASQPDADAGLAYVARFNLGVALANLGDRAGAEASYREALRQNPAFLQGHLNLGTLLEQQGRIDEALAQWRCILALDPALLERERGLHVQAINNIARRLEMDKHLAEAKAYLDRSLALDPEQPDALQHWMHLRQKQCEWPTFAAPPGVSPALLRSSVSALSALSAFDDPADLLANARHFVARKVPAGLPALAPAGGYAHRRLRVGYLSSDLCLHPVALLTVELFELHDRSRVDVFAFCWSREDGSQVRRRIVGAADTYVAIGDLDDEAAARRIREHEIDILVDLHGLTSGVRPGILARRPAPVQLTYLGYPGTTAMPSIDYVVADRFVLPEALQPFFTERPLYLPHCFQSSDRKREIAPTPARADCGLPDDAFVFCSFNNNYKFTPALFDRWMRILRSVPGSVLWLLADNPGAQENLVREAAARGIDPARLVFGARVAPPLYLARYRLADLFLDTVPFNAGTTANDALWMELPVLTCPGRTFASRMAGSLLNTLGLDELIAHDLDDYEQRAIAFGTGRRDLAAVRQRLARARRESPLFDMPRFVHDLEDAYERVAVRQPAPDTDTALPAGGGQAAVAGQDAFLAGIVNDLTRAHRLMQQQDLAAARALCESVLARMPEQVAAREMLALLDQHVHVQAAQARLPGAGFPEWLAWLHQRLRPAAVLDIRDDTAPASLADGDPVDLAVFVDVHGAEHVLRALAGLWPRLHAGSVVAIHNTLPVTAATATPERHTIFWVGDTWKAVPALRALQPDLEVATVACFPSGLTVIRGLGSRPAPPADRIDAAAGAWRNAAFEDHAGDIAALLNLVPNDTAAIEALLAR